MSRLKVPVTPSVIKWCRMKAGYGIEDASRKIGRSVEEIQGWEDGAIQPTLPQARKAAEAYKRPLAVFFLPESPRDFSTLRDFRTLPREYPEEFSPELNFLVREAQMHQEWASEYLRDVGGEELSFVGSASLQNDPKVVAEKIRDVLSVSINGQTACRTREEALIFWIRKVEAAGIFVFQQRAIDPVEARGLVMCDKYAPFIFLNAKDAKAGRLFTLAHELVHLWINESGISNLEGIDAVKRTRSDNETKIETFCNNVASEVLVDSVTFEASLRMLPNGMALEKRIANLSREFNVSEEVIARKLLQLNRINQTQYIDLRTAYQARWCRLEEEEKRLRKGRERGPSYYRLKVFNNGYAFTRTVISAYQSGFILGREASGLLGVKVNHLGRLAECASFR